MANQNEGIRRLHMIGRVTALGGGALGLVFWFVIWAKAQPPQLGQQFGLANLIDYVAPPLLLGAAISLVAWLVDGFLTRSPQQQ